MSVLRASGPDFDVDAFLKSCPWPVSASFRRGVARVPGGRVSQESGFNFSVSNAGFDEFDRQKEQTIEFLRQNEAEIRRLVGFAGVTGVVLDFGIAWRDAAAQSDQFPAELVRLAGACGLSLELSHYPVSQPAAG